MKTLVAGIKLLRVQETKIGDYYIYLSDKKKLENWVIILYYYSKEWGKVLTFGRYGVIKP